MTANAFYDRLPPQPDFAALARDDAYTPLPDDWMVGTADIVGSTQAVAEGRYKTVNMVGAAVISAQINAHEGAAFPFVFGGDGAAFAVPPEWRERSAHALEAVRNWSQSEFDMTLRVAMVSVADIRAAGRDMTVARFQASEGVDYAMFAGGGASWAEAQMKAGKNDVARDSLLTDPDLTGLSCRWSHMPSQHGSILSLVIVPVDEVPGPQFAALAEKITGIAARLDRSGTPSPAEGPGAKWPPAALDLDVKAMGGPPRSAWRKVMFESLLAWVLMRTGLRVGGFDARRYRKVVGANADFRKFEDGLKMTLDCDPQHEAELLAVLDQGVAEGVIRYGVHRQSEAMMTCIVPSVMTDDHVHFVDGAAGGYTAAASQLKESSAT